MLLAGPPSPFQPDLCEMLGDLLQRECAMHAAEEQVGRPRMLHLHATNPSTFPIGFRSG